MDEENINNGNMKILDIFGLRFCPNGPKALCFRSSGIQISDFVLY